jgi:uncharacterized protein (TIGR02453 family)
LAEECPVEAMTTEFNGFPASMLEFLHELEANNRRDWFLLNKSRYEREVLEPALDFIAAMSSPLADFAPAFLALPKRSGGSLMRVYRDTRFARDKRPYKTNVGIQFRHHLGKDVHAPGYYVHIDTREVFVGAGAWRPPSEALKAIRAAIDEHPRRWIAARDDSDFASRFVLSGESLRRPPRGYGGDHAMVDDLKRKSFIALHYMDHRSIEDVGFVDEVTKAFRSATPFMRFLCAALRAPF